MGLEPHTDKLYAKGIKNGCPYVRYGDQRHIGLCLGRRPCTSRGRVQGRSQGTNLSAWDLHNAWTSILNPFYNMECEKREYDKIRREPRWTFMG